MTLQPAFGVVKYLPDQAKEQLRGDTRAIADAANAVNAAIIKTDGPRQAVARLPQQQARRVLAKKPTGTKEKWALART
jgi:hypothetical protein